jgi:hypothetical protein
VRTEKSSKSAKPREAAINHIGATPVGALLFIPADELDRLGVDVEQVDAVFPRIEDERLHLEATDE